MCVPSVLKRAFFKLLVGVSSNLSTAMSIVVLDYIFPHTLWQTSYISVYALFAYTVRYAYRQYGTKTDRVQNPQYKYQHSSTTGSNITGITILVLY